MALATRTSKANSWGADIYLSIHHNAGINGGSGEVLQSIDTLTVLRPPGLCCRPCIMI